MGEGHPTVETPSPLGEVTGIRALFITRLPDIDTLCERAEAIERLRPAHLAILERELGPFPIATAEQVHGNIVTSVTESHGLPVPGSDGLATSTKGLTLGIYVADCAPVWIVARDARAGALVHSGKKGTEAGIVTQGIHTLRENHGIHPADMVVVIGPCIRPPCYEIDFAKQILQQAADAGVSEIHDTGICTACHPGRYYSYRREKGLTGRMLATLTLV
jgi:polyphenol oxidase